jgi:hypothetical protein
LWNAALAPGEAGDAAVIAAVPAVASVGELEARILSKIANVCTPHSRYMHLAVATAANNAAGSGPGADDGAGVPAAAASGTLGKAASIAAAQQQPPPASGLRGSLTVAREPSFSTAARAAATAAGLALSASGAAATVLGQAPATVSHTAVQHRAAAAPGVLQPSSGQGNGRRPSLTVFKV